MIVAGRRPPPRSGDRRTLTLREMAASQRLKTAEEELERVKEELGVDDTAGVRNTRSGRRVRPGRRPTTAMSEVSSSWHSCFLFPGPQAASVLERMSVG